MENISLILGAPGCGKTTRLMDILTEELKANDPNKIAFVSFTRKGTYEGVSRAMDLYGLSEDALPYFRTLHSIGFRTGNYTKYDMISKSDYRTFSEAMGMRFSGYYSEDLYSEDDKYLFIHFMNRNNPATAKAYLQDMDLTKLKEVETNFIRYKAFAKVNDFTDIIERFIEVGEPLPVDIAIIDEAQDLTTLQWKMCEVAFSNCKRVYIAGDDDQAIYEWSGADVKYFLNIKASSQDILKKSFRLQKNILTLAKSVTQQIGSRIDKQFEPVNDEGHIFVHNSLEDIALNREESWYFLSRNNWFLTKYSDYLKKNAYIFMEKEKPSFAQKQVDAIKVFEAARKRKKLTDTEEMKLKVHLKGPADLSKPWYDNMNFHNDTIAYYRDLIRNKTSLGETKITVNTIHGVKGGEADNVVLMLDITKAVRTNMERNPDSELRCLYVAVTRAKKNLHIVHSSSKNGYDHYLRRYL
jgi:superfamily I DNA/RNA helicase